MADDATDQTPPAEKDDLDLSSLSSLSLGPDWLSGKKSATRLPKGDREDHAKGPRGPRRDRRGGMDRRDERTERGGRGPRGPRPARGERHERRERPVQHEPFAPIVEVDFYPEEEPFKVLSQAIRNSCRTFELFEIARLILDKPDRFVCVIRDPNQKEGETALLHASVPDGLPFASEEEALAHVFRHYMDEFFTVETIEVDPPAGSFQMVHKCGMTGELLGPPNYHRYQAICREHHAAKLSHVPYARFEQRIESSREEEDIQAWLTKMKTQTRYTSKENPEQVFSNQEDARLYLFAEAKEKLVRPAYSARCSGKSLALLNPSDRIRRSVEYHLEGQKRFPLETANHLRGRLRRMHFAVYKRGSKGVSFVCAVKRHFRKPDEVLADNLQALIDFLEAHPNFPAKNLPKAYLGGKTEKTGEEKPAAETKAPTSAKAEDADATAEKDAPEAAAETAQPDEPDIDPAALKQLKTDLHYLVSQGYVIEYSDGRLYVPPIREDEIRHLEKQKAAAEAKEEEATESAAVKPTGEVSPEADTEEVAKPEDAAAKPQVETSEEVPAPAPEAAVKEEESVVPKAAVEDEESVIPEAAVEEEKAAPAEETNRDEEGTSKSDSTPPKA